MNILDIEQGFGKNIHAGSLVLYFKEQLLGPWATGGCKKGIWRVVHIEIESGLKFGLTNVLLENIVDKTSFHTDITNLVCLEVVKDTKYYNRRYITNYSLNLLEGSVQPASSVQETNNNQQGNPIVKTNKIMNKNITAAKAAATLTVGKTLNKVLLAKIRPQIPLMVRGYADHALANVVVANLASFIVDNFAADNRKAVFAADAMMQSAMVEFLESFNLDEIITDMISGVELPDVIDNEDNT